MSQQLEKSPLPGFGTNNSTLTRNEPITVKVVPPLTDTEQPRRPRSSTAILTDNFTFLPSSLFRLLDAAALLVLIGAQAHVINEFIAIANGYRMRNYLWYIGDGILLVVFLVAVIVSQKEVRDRFYKYLDGIDIAEYGVLPCGHLLWLMYSALLIAKTVYLVETGVTEIQVTKGFWCLVTLRIAIAAASLVFFLLVNTNHETDPDSDRSRHIANLCSSTSLEIMDSVELEGNLFDMGTDAPQGLAVTMLTLGSLNFLLPTLRLLKLSVSHRHTHLKLSLADHTIKLVFINIPYLVLRIYLIVAFDVSVSVFLVKNVLSILVSLRFLVPDYVELFKRSKEK